MGKQFKGFSLSDRVREKLKDKEFLKKEFSKGRTAQELMEIPDSSMGEFYRGAYLLFDSKRYSDAANAFLFLATLNPYNYEYWLGLGMATQMCRDYESAIDAYEMAAITEIDSPVPYFYLSKCFYAINDKENALDAIDIAIEYADESEEFAALRVEALAAKNLLMKKM